MEKGLISNYTGVNTRLDSLAAAQLMPRDRVITLTGSGTPCRKRASSPVSRAESPGTRLSNNDRRRYRRHNCIEIMFGRLKDCRRVVTRYDRCPTTFFSGIVLAAIVIFWL